MSWSLVNDNTKLIYISNKKNRSINMSQNRSFFKSVLTQQAFAPAPEIKPNLTETATLYDKYEKLITKYVRSGPENKAFQEQFKHLLEKVCAWGVDYDCITSDGIDGITKIKQDIFLPAFSSMQTELYFETIKKNLECILLALQNTTIPFKKRKEVYQELCVELAMCGPGIYRHIEAAYLALQPAQECVERWLSDLRNAIIKIFSDNHILKRGVAPGDQVHALNGFLSYAQDQKWSPTCTAGNSLKDPLAMVNGKIFLEDLTAFHAFFEQEYNSSAIRICLQANKNTIDQVIKKTADLLSYKVDSWNKCNDDYSRFVNQLTISLKNIGIDLRADEFLELNDDYTEFRICSSDKIIDKVCEHLFQPSPQLTEEKEIEAKPKPSVTGLFKTKNTESFLVHLMRCDQKQAEISLKILEKEAKCESNALAIALSQKYTMMDNLHGRVFHNISPFQYAIWALDTPMLSMLLKYLPKEKAAEQLAELEQFGVKVEHRSPAHFSNEKHFDFGPLRSALQTYADHYDDWSPMRRIDYWKYVVGIEEIMAPAYIAWQGFATAKDVSDMVKQRTEELDQLKQALSADSHFQRKL